MRLHEVTLNPHTHSLIFSCLSIASVDGKQHLNEVVFSVVDFHCKENDRTTGAAQKQLCAEVLCLMLDSTSSDPNLLNTIITGDEFWLYRYDPGTIIFLTMKI